MKRTTKRGFTLIELVVVLAIIAALAGLVIPQVSMLGRTTDMATSAKCQADVASNLQLFFVLQKRFPQNMDSLLVGTSGGAPTGVYVPVDSSGASGNAANANLQISGLPRSGPSIYMAMRMGDFTGNELRSISRCGFDTVMDHDATEVNANNSGKFQRAVSSGTIQLCEISGSADSSSTYPGIVRALFPATGTVPDGSRLVAMGFGPSNSALSKTTIQAPIYPGCDGKYYGRYIAIFQTFNTGERAVLVAVVDPYGRYPDYTIQQYNESLPNGARQG